MQLEASYNVKTHLRVQHTILEFIRVVGPGQYLVVQGRRDFGKATCQENRKHADNE
jgi:hypothetical protein